MPDALTSPVYKLVIILGCLFLGAVIIQNAHAQEPTDSCAGCHLNVRAAWENSPHALAFHNAAFQNAWSALGNDIDCLACHTTGFVPRTGHYEHEGVTCEACHGPTPANHPGEPIPSQPDVSVCQACHVPTFSEWQRSAHGEKGMDCTECHNPHPQQLQFPSSNELCTSCHVQIEDNFAHASHIEQNCVDCHYHNPMLDSGDHILTGNLMPTGHYTTVDTIACTDCHARYAEPIEVAFAGNAPLLQARVREKELQAQLASVQAQGENTATVRIFQGLLLGLIVGGGLTAAITYSRRRNGSKS